MIGIDIDDVITEYVLGCINALHMEPLDWSGDLRSMFNGRVHDELWKTDESLTEFLLNMEPVPGAGWGLIEMRRLGIPFMYVSAGRPDGAPYRARVAWMKRYFLPSAETAFCGCFDRKVEYLHSNKHLTHLIDDHPTFLAAAADAGMTVYVYDRPWNRHLLFGTRVMGWSHLISALKRDLLHA